VLNLADDVMHVCGLWIHGFGTYLTIEIVGVALVFESFEIGVFVLVFLKKLDGTSLAITLYSRYNDNH
jgi:hypothetical protein